MRAELPPNEATRLAVLASYNILDTAPEPALDELTTLASQICHAPIALVVLIDRERQWFKANRGLPRGQMSREVSFCAHALLQPDEMLVVRDAREDERFLDNPLVTGEPGIRFYAGAPLLSPEGQPLGTLCVIDTEPRDLSPQQREGLCMLSHQVMALLDLRREHANISEALANRIQIEHTLRENEGRFEAFMDSSPIVAFLKDRHGRYVYVNRPWTQRFQKPPEQVIGRLDEDLWPHLAPCLCEHDGQVLAGQDTVAVLEIAPTLGGEGHYWQVYKFPLERGGERFLAGVALDITTSKRHEQQLKRYQEQLEVALAEVEARSITDELTGLNNRGAFNRKFEDEFDRAHRYGRPLSLLMLDVDRFKQFNDSFGHPAGDQVLRAVAMLLFEEARTNDFVARYGGEEFAIILPNTGREGAFILAQRFRRAVESLPVAERAMTVSVGVATFSPGTPNTAALLEAADRALYEAKHSGRNRVEQSPRG